MGSSHPDGRKVECCQEMQIVLSRRNANYKTIVSDEKWVYLVDVAPKETLRAWVDSAGDRTISSKMVLVIVESNFNKSLYCVEILHDSGTVNTERYLTFLQNMIEQFRPKLPPWQMTIQHDNARPHAAVLVQQWIASQNITLLPQPAYSPDTNLMDRYIFRNFETFR